MIASTTNLQHCLLIGVVVLVAAALMIVFVIVADHILTGGGELKPQSFRTKRVCKTGLPSENAMPKTLEAVSNVSTISTRPDQSRSISGTTAMALALIFARIPLAGGENRGVVKPSPHFGERSGSQTFRWSIMASAKPKHQLRGSGVVSPSFRFGINQRAEHLRILLERQANAHQALRFHPCGTGPAWNAHRLCGGS
jgi:hypothetical protein